MSDLIIDKKGFLAKIMDGFLPSPTIEIGCGSKKINDKFIGIDLIDTDCVDIVGDAMNILSNFPDLSVGAIHSSHFIEHVPDLEPLLSEFLRVLKPNGYIELTAPHFSNPFFYSDPTHKSFFGLYTMSYFSRDEILSRRVPSYSRVDGLELISIRLVFKSLRPRYLRHLTFKVFEFLFNLNGWMQELYEEIFSGIIPCYEVVYKLAKTNATK